MRPSAPLEPVLASDALSAAGLPKPTPACPVDRVPRRTRNQWCIAIIGLGLLNYLAYTLTYAALGGDAHNGRRSIAVQPDGSHASKYFVRGHFIHSISGEEREVSRAAWIYSYVHSISVPITSGALIISMLILARPHIIATMRGGFIGGETIVAAFGTVVLLITAGTTVFFVWDFLAELGRR